MKTANQIFNPEERKKISEAILQAEDHTSGEIRVHIENVCKTDPMEQDIRVFHTLGMQNTELRNGVLIYLAVVDRKFAIIGDKGINERVPADFWNAIRNEMGAQFKNKNFPEGIITAITQTGEKLKAFFPSLSGNRNELSNEVSVS